MLAVAAGLLEAIAAQSGNERGRRQTIQDARVVDDDVADRLAERVFVQIVSIQLDIG
jgi:hypothetical protein